MCYNEWSVIPKSNLCLDVCDSGTISAVVNLTHHRIEQGPHYTMILDDINIFDKWYVLYQVICNMTSRAIEEVHECLSVIRVREHTAPKGFNYSKAQWYSPTCRSAWFTVFTPLEA